MTHLWRQHITAKANPGSDSTATEGKMTSLFAYDRLRAGKGVCIPSFMNPSAIKTTVQL